MKDNIRIIVAIITMALIATALTWFLKLTASVPDEKNYQALIAKFDKSYPGRGLADYGDNPVADIPKAYSMVLMAELNRYQKQNLDSIPALSIASGKWLLAHSDENHNGITGWGLPFEWDAYGDGSVNPPNSEYTISTAIVIDGLLSWMETDKTAPREQIMTQVGQALKPYLDPACKTPTGLFPFSLQKPDYQYDTFNPSSYLAGEMQRYSRYVQNPQDKRLLQQTADRVVMALLKQKKSDPNGNWYWTYSAQENNANDMAHAGYIIEGLRTYAQNQGNLVDQIDLEKLFQHLNQFPSQSSLYVRAWPVFRKDIDDPARTYDIGMGLFLASTGPKNVEPVKNFIARAALDYRMPDGQYAKYPYQGPGTQIKTGQQPSIVIQEYQAYVLYGLSYYLYK